jgi:hypothetical protein
MTKYVWCKKTYKYDGNSSYLLWLKGKKYEITYSSKYNSTIKREYVGDEPIGRILTRSFSISNNEFKEYFSITPNKLNKQIHTV